MLCPLILFRSVDENRKQGLTPANGPHGDNNKFVGQLLPLIVAIAKPMLDETDLHCDQLAKRKGPTLR
jgi:hypothetical protein